MIVDGQLVRWEDDRGFGFISPADGGKEVFIHIKAFPAGPCPKVGEKLRFEVEADSNGKLRAVRVKRPGLKPVARVRGANSARQWGGATLLLVPLFLILFSGLAFAWKVPKSWALYYLVVSLVCFAVYWHDKSSARRGGWRVAESSLHFWALIGGWPGAILGQQYLRHKSAKAEFRATFWVTVVANVGALIWLASPLGRGWLLKTPLAVIA